MARLTKTERNTLAAMVAEEIYKLTTTPLCLTGSGKAMKTRLVVIFNKLRGKDTPEYKG